MSPLRRVAVGLGAALALGAGGWMGWRQWDATRGLQWTDDAYVRGEVTRLAPREAGYVIAILVDDNTPVAAHQTLVRLDPRDYRLAVYRTEAALEQARAQLAAVDVRHETQLLAIASAEAAQEAARAVADRNAQELRRAQELVRSSFGTQQALDAATANDRTARAAVGQAAAGLAQQRQVLQQIAADRSVAAAAVLSAQATLRTAQLALEDTEVWSPIPGVVANRRTRVGEYVTAGTQMLSIVPVEGLWIEAQFRETQLGGMAVDRPAVIRLDQHRGIRICGYVESLGPASASEFALFPPDNATGNFTKIVRRFPVRVRPNRSDANAGLLRSGQSADVMVAVDGQAEAEGCRFDAGRDRQPPSLPQIPPHRGFQSVPPWPPQ